MKHRYKSIDGAVRRIRELEKIVARYEEISSNLQKQRDALAKLSADGPAFFNPLDAFAAKSVRNGILKSLGMNPDGTFIQNARSA